MTSLDHQTSLSPAGSFRLPAAIRRTLLAVGAIWKAAASRREVRHMLELDDRMLKDIGLLRSDVVGVLSEPIGKDPSVGLRLRTVENRVRQRSREAQIRGLTTTASGTGRKAA